MQELFHNIFRYNRPDDSKMRLISAGICILIVNIIGYLSSDYRINAVGSLGVFTFLHYNPKENTRIIKRMVFVGIVLFFSHALGMVSTLNFWLPPVIIAFIAFFSRLLFRVYHIDKPGDIFAILCAAAGATSDFTVAEMPLMSGYFLFGVILSIVVGMFTLKVEHAPHQSVHVNPNIIGRIRQDPRMIVDAFFYAITLFFASYANMAFGLGNYSWVIVSCSAILQGNTLLQIFSRHFQRIIGTIVGLLTAALLLSVPMNILTKIAIIVVFYVIVEYFMPRNYSIGIFFVTNMVMLQMTLTAPDIWPELLRARLLGIIIGSILGALAATLQYKLYQFFSESIINERLYDE